MRNPLLVICGITPQMKERLAPHFDLHFLPEISDFDEWASRNAGTATQVLTDGHYGVPADIAAALPELAMVSCYGVGYDNIDTALCQGRGIVATHTPDVLNAEVASTAILLLLACYRAFRRDEAWARDGTWASQGNAPLTRSLDHQTIGLLGMGRIGQEIARKLQPWSPRILYHARTQKEVPFEYVASLEDLACRSDALVVITPGGAGTRHLVDQKVIEALGPQGTLVNVARGSVVDESALITALEAGKLGWAGLDVFENEPHIPQALREMDNTVLLPHAGSATVETRAAMGNLAVDNLLSWRATGAVLTPVPECRSYAVLSEP